MAKLTTAEFIDAIKELTVLAVSYTHLAGGKSWKQETWANAFVI